MLRDDFRHLLHFIVYLICRVGSAGASAYRYRFSLFPENFGVLCVGDSPGYRHLAQRNVAIAFGNEITQQLPPYAAIFAIRRESFVQRQTHVHAAGKNGSPG
jgi:hypothetical protein